MTKKGNGKRLLSVTNKPRNETEKNISHEREGVGEKATSTDEKEKYNFKNKKESKARTPIPNSKPYIRLYD